MRNRRDRFAFGCVVLVIWEWQSELSAQQPAQTPRESDTARG